jgi:hypothetical protein
MKKSFGEDRRNIMKKLLNLICVFSIIIALAGCSVPSNSETSKEETLSNEDDTAQLTEIEDLLPLPIPFVIHGVTVSDVENGDFKTAMVDKLITARTADETCLNTIEYVAAKFADIEAFYSLDKLRFNGYRKDHVFMGEAMFNYRYVPTSLSAENLDNDGSYSFNFMTGIQIGIFRTDYKLGDMTYPVTIGKASATIGGRIIDDNLSFAETVYEYNELAGIIGDTWFIMQVPKSIDNDAAIEIGRRLISTAELVNVDEEIGRMAAE